MGGVRPGGKGRKGGRHTERNGKPAVGEGCESDSTHSDAEGPIGFQGLTIKLCMFEFSQNDAKKDSGVRLVRRGLATSMAANAAFKGIVLSSSSSTYLSRADRPLLEQFGLAGINCSWNRVEELPWARLQRQGHHRILPHLLAANTINYGRPFKLNTAEALGAALIIAGFDQDAAQVFDSFPDGEQFVRLNGEVLRLYSQASSSDELKALQDNYLKKTQQEAAERREKGMDLPPSASDSEEVSDEERDEDQLDAAGNTIKA